MKVKGNIHFLYNINLINKKQSNSGEDEYICSMSLIDIGLIRKHQLTNKWQMCSYLSGITFAKFHSVKPESPKLEYK